MNAPAVFPALAIMAGVAVAVFLPTAHRLAWFGLPLATVFAAVAWRYRHGAVAVSLALVGFVAAGILLGASSLSAAAHSPLREFYEDARAKAREALPPVVIEGVIREDAFPTEYGAAMTVDTTRVQTPCGWLPATGGLRLAMTGEIARGRVDQWLAGRRVRMPVLLRSPTSFRDPGVPDETFAMMRRGIAMAGSVKSGALVEIVQPGHALAEAAAAARAYTRRSVAGAIPGRPLGAAIVTAILIGDRGGLDPEVERRLQEAGTYHVIAISGGNVAILAGVAMLLLRLARVPRRTGSLILALVICAYGYVAGGGASVARATLAAAVYFVATAADHRSPALNVLGTVALVAVITNPLAVFDPGLMLSYGATLALLLAADRVLRSRGSKDAETRRDADKSRKFPEAPRPPGVSARLGVFAPSASRCARQALLASGALLIGTIAAELALLPIVASIFHRVTLAALVLNFLAIPLMTVAQIGGLAILVLHPISTMLASTAGTVAGAAAELLVRSTVLLTFAPWLTWRVPAPPMVLVTIYYAGWVVAIFAGARHRVRSIAVIVGASCACLIMWPAFAGDVLVPFPPRPGQLRVTFLDVGQGDAILVQFPGGTSMLVDAAGLPGSNFDLGDRVVTPSMLALGVTRLDYLAITHGDPDHVEGSPSVARDFLPRELWQGVPVPPHQTLRTLEAMIAKRRSATRLVRTDDRLLVGPAEVRVLYPPEPDWERQRVRNDDSIVMELRYGDVSIVLPGDIGASVEESLAPKLSDAPLRILKAAHHGSATSSSAAWLAAARPAAVVFSCGRDNRYGHPAPVVLERVKTLRAAVFRTDLDGAITVATDGKEIRISTFSGRISVITGNHEGPGSETPHKEHQEHKVEGTREAK